MNCTESGCNHPEGECPGHCLKTRRHQAIEELRFATAVQRSNADARLAKAMGLPSQAPTASDGSTASYYELPQGATELQHLISHRNMNAQIGEIFRACFRYGMVAHSPQIRDIKKILFYAQAELERLEKANG